MHSPTYITFSLSIDAIESLDVVKERIEKALNCKLVGGQLAGVPCFACDLFGIGLSLGRWRGIGSAPIYEFHGMPHPHVVRGDPWQEIRIDQAVIDLLERGGAGLWREPCPEEKIAAGKYHPDDV